MQGTLTTRDREPSNRLLVAAAMAGEEHVLSDMDGYQDWLAEHCIRVEPSHCRFGYIPKGDQLDAMIETLDVAQLLALTLYPNKDIAGSAALALRERFLADRNTVARIQAAAIEARDELAADESGL